MGQESTEMLPQKLELKFFNAAKFQPLIDAAQAQGYRFSLLKDLCTDPNMRRKLYGLVKEGVLNSPQSDGTFESFALFCERLLQPYYLDVADSYMIATWENEWIGLTGITVDPDTRVGNTGLMVVKKAYQGQGIAKALKALSLAHALEQGATMVTTKNHINNAPMLAINRLFGFVSAHSQD